jgi:hypothetical protein
VERQEIPNAGRRADDRVEHPAAERVGLLRAGQVIGPIAGFPFRGLVGATLPVLARHTFLDREMSHVGADH